MKELRIHVGVGDVTGRRLITLYAPKFDALRLHTEGLRELVEQACRGDQDANAVLLDALADLPDEKADPRYVRHTIVARVSLHSDQVIHWRPNMPLVVNGIGLDAIRFYGGAPR